jgi:CubicO group peptidase (beta-lactamase class C family)
MNAKRIIKISLWIVAVLGVVALIKIAPLAWLATGGLRTPVRVPAPDYWPTNGWRTCSPEEQGFDSAKLAEGLQSLQENQVDIDSLMIIRNGYVVLDAHFYPYDGKFPHDLASVTKSVMTTLIAIAAEQGKLDLDKPVIAYFPKRTIANLDERKAHMTVRHLASMRNGMESGCYEGDDPTIQAMRVNPDWVQAALDRPMVAEPGEEFCYDSPGMHLLSAILQEATGMTTLDFARQYLFTPLGIQDAVWESDPQGISRGWGDLHLKPEDLAKIGYLWLHRGKWDGQQIVSEAWVLDSVSLHSKFIEPDFGYGYGWWITDKDYQASGRGGQRVRVMASLNLMVVATGANFEYDEVESWLIPMMLQMKDSRPANPEGVMALDAILTTLEESETAWPVNPTSQTASMISGKRYHCENNPAEIETIRMEFNDPEQATLHLKMGGVNMILPIGLDGHYRLSPEGAGFRGYWEDTQTFQFESFDIGLRTKQVHFVGDGLEISLPEAGLIVACQIQNP